MNYGLSERKIKQMSDTYAFRRGKRYVAAKKVTLRNYQSGDLLVEAAVQGEDLFTVTVRVKEHGVDAGCNCPSLAMDQSFCGHIVAVLLAMHHVQVYGTPGGNQSLIRPFATTRQTEDAAVTAYLQTLSKAERAKIRFDVNGSAIVMESITAQQRFIISPMYFDRLLQRRDHLRNLADVWLSPPLKQRLVSGPPTVELALDREAGGLELLVTFSYQGVRINPLQETNWLGRDVSLEGAVLRYVTESGFLERNGRYRLEEEAAEYQFLKGLLDPRVVYGELVVQVTESIRQSLPNGPFHPRIDVDTTDRLDWLTFRFSMDGIPEVELKQVLQSLVTRKTYHRLKNGQFVSFENRAFEQLQRVFRQLEAAEQDQLEAVLRAPALPNLKHLVGASFLHVHKQLTERWLELKNGTGVYLNFPEVLDRHLYPYQRAGIQFMANLAGHDGHGILADEMGLGKTIQAIGYLETLPPGRVLIVAPASLLHNWQAELTRFAPTRTVHLLTGARKHRLDQIETVPADGIFLISYPSLRADMEAHQAVEYDVVIFDEAQHLKNPASQTAVRLRRIRAKRRFALTGTPLENRTDDLWSIFRVIFPSLLPDLQTFQTWSHDEIKRFIRPFLMRRTKDEVLQDLPKKQIVHHYTDLGPTQKKLYASYLAKLQLETLQHLDETKREDRIKLLAGLTRLRQICCDPALFVEDYTGESTKLERLLTLIEEKLAAGHRILIFSQYTKMLARIRERLAAQQRAHFLLTGETPVEDRVALCERFNAGEVDLFLISLKAGGTGLNLATADTVILYDSWWNPAVEQQAADRAHRLGQQSPVEVIKLLMTGTIEEKMAELQDRKATMIDAVLSDQKPDILTIRELVRLLDSPAFIDSAGE
ncbi:Non-specific serine/threonine protein kinase [Exiguobacterium sibiricum 255-15]|uniref:Non-specific serine/threonine protein kinase n=1 Tax=Exiguobacterium sibiricum (strain DSM 17290 / CCUG 55495 / CIP 109462 / JCM 13490 / 255-15) TaxID=262543 RepID=B1YGY1_EXIS2|nr:SNF2-related protein [Exiguobacterium sibiricum]ACB61042.1 Non-specific serine/threonine protein kinase [Exiguobacterium sibiricum 255-15]